MPLYEYECEACGHRFELIQRFSDAPPSACPVCGGAVHKRQSAPAFQFKGTGWYITDYARKDQESGTKPSGKGDAAGGDKAAPASGTSPTGKDDKATKASDSPAPASSSTPASPAADTKTS